MSYSCTLSYTPFSVLGTKIESSLQMRRGKAKHIHAEVHMHTHNITSLQRLRQKKRGAYHTQTQICFIRIYTNMKSEFICPQSVLSFILCCVCLFFLISLSYVFPAALNLLHNTMSFNSK